jgi:hypothetical protein
VIVLTAEFTEFPDVEARENRLARPSPKVAEGPDNLVNADEIAWEELNELAVDWTIPAPPLLISAEETER